MSRHDQILQQLECDQLVARLERDAARLKELSPYVGGLASIGEHLQQAADKLRTSNAIAKLDLSAENGLALIAAAGGRIQHRDHEHTAGEMAVAAACYATPGWDGVYQGRPGPRAAILAHWPWPIAYWSPTPHDRVDELARAGALIAAEIDRHLRNQAIAKSAELQHLQDVAERQHA